MHVNLDHVYAHPIATNLYSHSANKQAMTVHGKQTLTNQCPFPQQQFPPPPPPKKKKKRLD